jgi:succinoglycan biosynthesis protein ExoA
MLPNHSHIPISIIIPTYNEASNISRCLDSILNNDYPVSMIEIIIVDGFSTDSTVKIVNDYILSHPNIQLFTNPDRYQSFALNIGIRNASPHSEAIMRADAHCIFPASYIADSVQTLIKTKADAVGGVMSPIGKTPTQKAIAYCMCHPFGVGDARFHLGNYSGDVDTVYLGFYKKDVFERIGLYDTSFITNEDAELNLRLTQAGGRIFLNQHIIVQYYPRKTFIALAIQYFRYGKGRARTVIKHRKITSLRQIAPLCLIATFIVSLSLSLRFSTTFILPVAIYFTVVIIASIIGSIRMKDSSLVLASIGFSIIHLAWAFGFIISFTKHKYINFVSRLSIQ